jgi:hypothetical protein
MALGQLVAEMACQAVCLQKKALCKLGLDRAFQLGLLMVLLFLFIS